MTSAAFTPPQAGTYRWVASYGGDANSMPVAGACNDPNESTVVSAPLPPEPPVPPPPVLCEGRLATIVGRVGQRTVVEHGGSRRDRRPQRG